MSTVIDLKVCKEMKNIYRSLGIDLLDLSPDRPWTPDGDRALIEFCHLGMTPKEIAIEFKRSLESVNNRMAYLNKMGSVVAICK